MARYELAVRTTATASNVALCQLRAGAADMIMVREIGIFLASAVATTVGVIRAATAGTASGSPQVGQNRDPNGSAASGQAELTWSAAPTLAGTPIYMRRIGAPATIGSGMVWSWAPGNDLVIPAAGGLLVWNLTGGVCGTLDVYIAWEE